MSESEEDDEEISSAPKQEISTGETIVLAPSAVKENFKSKFVEMQNCVESDLPATIAKLNTELDMLARGTTLVRSSSDDDVDDFIWKFRFEFDYECQQFSLPIQNVDHIEKLDGALLDENTYHGVVCFCLFMRLKFPFVLFIIGRYK